MFLRQINKKFFLSTMALFFLILNIVFFYLFSNFPSEKILFLAGCFNILIFISFIVLFILDQFVFLSLKRHKFFFLFVYLFFIAGIFLFHQERLETGHDPGSYMGFAARISRTISLNPSDETAVTSFHYFFENGKIIFQNKEIWPFILSTFYHVLGIKGFALCIILLHTLGLFFIIRTGVEFLGAKDTNILLFLMVFLFSYYNIYYTRSGYIENILFFQSWAGIYYFLRFINSSKKSPLFLSFLYIISIYLTRPEASFYLIGFLLALFSFWFRRYKINPLLIILCIFVFVIFAYLIDLLFFDSFIINGFRKLTISMSSSESGVYTEYNRFLLILVFSINVQIISLAIFGYLPFFKKGINNRNIFYIFILFLPQFLFLILPTIQLSLPWAYRRYWVGIFTLGFLLLFVSKNHSLYKSKIALILLTSISLFSGGKILGMFSGETLISDIKKIDSFLDKNVDLSKTGLISIDYSANYIYILSDYYGWPVFIDQVPLKNLEIYDYFFSDKKDIFIFTFLSKKDAVRNFYKKNLGINIMPDDISLEAIFPIRVNRIGTFFDINSFFNFRRLFSGYSDVIKEGQILFEEPVFPYSSSIFVYRLSKKSYFLPQNYNNLDFDKNIYKIILPEVPYRVLRL